MAGKAFAELSYAFCEFGIGAAHYLSVTFIITLSFYLPLKSSGIANIRIVHFFLHVIEVTKVPLHSLADGTDLPDKAEAFQL